MQYNNTVDNLHLVKKNAGRFLEELFFPSFCLGCKKEGQLLCQDCKASLEISEYSYCLCTKHPLRLPPEQKSGKCSRCQDKKLSGLYFALSYQEKALTRNLIYQFKYPPHIKALGKTLAAIIIEHLLLIGKNTEDIWENSVLIPIPMELKKMKKRGYNQAQELAEKLGELLHVPLALHSLVKIKKTKPQMELGAKERQENIADAFSIKNPAEFAGKKVFLIDDVYTTGSTMEECARVLKNAGAKQVWGITIARDE